MNYIESDDIYHIPSARWVEVSDEPHFDDMFDVVYDNDDDEDE